MICVSFQLQKFSLNIFIVLYILNSVFKYCFYLQHLCNYQKEFPNKNIITQTMISQSKKKRLHIIQQINQRSRQKSRQSGTRQTSAERRKKIQASFNDFVHTMHNFPFSHSKSKFSNQSVKFNTGSIFYKQQNQSPSVKDIQPMNNMNLMLTINNQKDQQQNVSLSPQKTQHAQQLAYSKFSQDSNIKKWKENTLNAALTVKSDLTNEEIKKQVQQSSRFKDIQIEVSPDKTVKQKEEEIYNLSGNSGLQNSRNKSTHTQQLSAIKEEPIQQKQLAQTSKFNTFQVNNQQFCQIDQGQQIKVPINLVTIQNRDEAVSNNSSAIFFTSQFHQFINRQKTDSKQDLTHQIIKNQQRPENQVKQGEALYKTHLDKQLQQNERGSFLKQSHKRHNTQFQQPNNSQQKALARNKSGRSIADSNASSLKYSLYQSNVNAHQMLNYKLTNQLVVDPDNFLYPAIKINILADRIQKKKLHNIVADILQFKNLWNLKLKIQKRQITQYFDAFLINKEINFQQKKNQIKTKNFIKKKEELLKILIFGTLKKQCFTNVKKIEKKVDEFYENIQTTLKQKCFRNIKIGWYNRKVNQQVDIYYLSKIFFHMKKVCKRQKQIDRNKVLHFYSKNMKRKYFRYFIQGVDNMLNQKIKNQTAQWHFDYNLIKRCIEGWKQRMQHQNKYISLAMTTKNSFKQTQDKRWKQIRTVDFRQLK